MPQSLVQIYLHIIFSTKHRELLIDSVIEKELFQYIVGVLKNNESHLTAIDGTEDHIHILTSLPRTVTVAKLVEEIKRNSSRWVKSKGLKYAAFYWQDGYSSFSVSPSKVKDVTQYIQNQKQHHQREDFKTEYRRFLKKHEVDFDERYVWD